MGFNSVKPIYKWLAEYRLTVLGFAVAVACCPTLMQAAFSPRWMVIAIGIPLVSTLDPRNVPEGIRWVLLWLLALAVISTTFASPDPLTGYFELIFMVLLCLTFVAGAGMVSLDDVLTGLGAGLAVSSVMILFNLNSNDGRGSGDVTGLFFNTEVLAEFAALVFVWALAKGRIFTAITAAIPLAFCGSRVSLLVAMVGALYIFRPKSNWLFAALIVGLSILAVSMIVLFGEGKMTSAEHRMTLWIATVFAWNQYGHGLGWFLTHYPLEQFAHSDALQMVAEIGIGAFAAIAIPVVAFRRGGERAERAVFIAVCIEVCVSFPLHLPATGFVSALVAGHLVGARYRLRMGERERRVEDGRGVQWGTSGDFATAGNGGRIGGAFPARSVLANSPGLRSGKDRLDPAEAR